MKISELARQTGLPAKAIRFYEDSGLIPAAVRDTNGYRHYGEADITRFRFIRRCRDLRIPLENIRQLIEIQTAPTASCGEVDRLLLEQHRRVRETIEELQALETQLEALIVACGRGAQLYLAGVSAPIADGDN